MKVMHIHDQDFQLAPLNEESTPYLFPAGIPVYLSSIIAEQRKRACSISMIRFNTHPQLSTVKGYYELKPCSNRPNNAIFLSLKKIIQAENPDIIHLHSVYYAVHPFMITFLRKLKPIVYTLHDVTPVCFWQTKLRRDGFLCDKPIGLGCLLGCYSLGVTTGYLKDIIKVLMNYAHLSAYRNLPIFLVPSGYLKHLLVTNGFEESRIKVLPHFSRFEPKTVYNENACCRILFAGRVVKEKGVREFAKALGLVNSRNWEAVIVGSGDIVEDVREIFSKLDILGKVKFTGDLSAEELAEQYASSDFLVFPSMVPESFGLVGIEAMSFGKPVIAFESGGVTEWLDNHFNGILVPRGDVSRLAEQIEYLIENKDVRRTMGENATKSVKTRFSAQRYIDDLLDCYCSIISRFNTKPY